MIDEQEKQLYDVYTKWILKKGSKFDKLSLKYFYADYRGLMANAPIAKNEDILFIPDAAIITLEMARKGTIGMKLKLNDANFIYPNNSTLSTYVLWESGNPETPWELFLKALPKSVSNFPTFFTAEERKLLTGSRFLKVVDELLEDMNWDYKEVCRCAPEFTKVAAAEDFMKIRTLVNSRIFGTKINGEENDAIVPYADMFNFKYGSDMTSWSYSDERKGFVVKANEDIKEGDEIFVYYGQKPNWNFFLFYGFVLENNKEDEVILEVSFLPSDKLRKLKEDLLDKKQEPKKVKIKATTENNKFTKAIGYMRYLVFDKTAEELKEVFFISIIDQEELLERAN